MKWDCELCELYELALCNKRSDLMIFHGHSTNIRVDVHRSAIYQQVDVWVPCFEGTGRIYVSTRNDWGHDLTRLIGEYVRIG